MPIFCIKRVDKTSGEPYLIVCREKERVQGKTAVFDQPNPGDRNLFFEKD